MNQKALIATAFEYAQISSLSTTMQKDLDQLISIMKMYHRPEEEIKKLCDLKMLLTAYRYTYTQSGLEKFLKL